MLKQKKIIIIGGVLIVLIVAVAIYISMLCDAKNCSSMSVKNGDYCLDHTCTIEYYLENNDEEWDGHCYNYRSDGTWFCDEHTCDLYSEDPTNCNEVVHYHCIKKKYSFGKCCSKHGCYFCGDILVEGADCCKEHKCAVSNCKEMVANASKADYCRDHTCVADSCYNQALKGKSYCNEHTDCKVTGCDNPREKYVEYCSKHRCSVTLCENAKEEGKSKCIDCLRKDGQKEQKSAYKDKLIVDANGKQLWKVYIKDTFRIDASYNGDGNFIIWLLDGNQEEYDLLCNEIGTYKLNTTRNVPDGYYYIKVEWNGGSWNAKWQGTYGK